MTLHAFTPPTPLFDPGAAPDEIRLAAGGARLLLAWGDHRAGLEAQVLRAACRCAPCTRARADGAFPAAFPGIAVTGIAPVSAYAVNLRFSDGHGRGIFPYGDLRALAAPLPAEQAP